MKPRPSLETGESDSRKTSLASLGSHGPDGIVKGMRQR